MNWKERWRLLLSSSDFKKGISISLLSTVLLALSLWINEQHYADPTMRLASFLFFEIVCVVAFVNGVYITMKTRKQIIWNPISIVTFVGLMILFIVLVLLFVIS